MCYQATPGRMPFYQQEPFHSPRIPFTGSIQGGLQEGKTITVSGRVMPGANRFHVNLQCGSRAGSDIALHFNPRYDSCPAYVVTNTLQHSTWGSEDRKHHDAFPSGSPFTLTILVVRDSYRISSNGNHFMDYKHRIPFTQVDTIVVDGMVQVNSIAFQNPEPYFPSQPGFPPYFPSQPGFPAPSPYPAPVVYSVPYKSIINGGLQPGRNITIQGVINPNAKRIAINLRFRSGTALHYNPRFDENTVVRNSHLMEKWGSEERSGGMPFHKGQPFMVTIICDSHHYNVLVNGKQVHTYRHRHTNLRDIDVLEVDGDLSLTSVVV